MDVCIGMGSWKNPLRVSGGLAAQEVYGDIEGPRWLQTFDEKLVEVKDARDFVLQIQQGGALLNLQHVGARED